MMARTHSATRNSQPTSRFHQDDGIVLGKGGEPIPVNPIRGVTTLNPHGPAIVQPEEHPALPPPPKPDVAFQFVCDKTTWQRNMDGWQALHLLNAIMKHMIGQELSVTLTEAEARLLPPDTRWHFRRMAVPAPSWDEPDVEVDATLSDRIMQLEAEVAELCAAAEEPAEVERLTDDELFDADPAALSRGDKIRRGKLLAALNRAEGATDDTH